MFKNSSWAKKFLAGFFLLSSLTSLGLTACGKKEAANGAPGGAGPVPPPAKLAAVVLNVSAASSGIATTGTVLAEQQVEVQTEIAGRVTRIGFPEGGHVSAGQVLVKLDDSGLRAQFRKASAQLHLAEAQEKRMKEQTDAGAVSAQEYDQVRAQLESAKGDADLLKAQLDKCEIKAPFGGEAGLRKVELGAVLQPGTRITTLQDLRSYRVEFSIPENQAAGVDTGMPVTFTVAGREDTLSAVIFAIEPGVDPDTRLLKMRARYDSPKDGKSGLHPGAFASVVLPLREHSALWIPAQAIVESARGTQVWRVHEGKAELHVFQPGTRTPEAVEVRQGLSAGDTVLISGLMQLKPGAAVNPILAN